jgi:RimJ/RimL family protein N-acetyltransferase
MQQELGIQYWPIFLLESDEHVGCCGLRPHDAANRVYELGVHICSNWWRQHLAEEAACAVIEYAFGTLRATAIFAGHNPNNKASQSLLLKVGFSYTHHEYYSATGLQHPSYVLTR